MAAEHWFRSHHGAPTDKKWVIIARKAQTIPGHVAVTWWALMDHASQASPRGSVAGFDCEALDAFMGFDDGTAARIVATLRKHRADPKSPPMIDGDTMSTWEKRQPKREDVSAERMRRLRGKKPDVTQCDAPLRNVTLETETETETETEEMREETDTTTEQHPPRESIEKQEKAAAILEMTTDMNVETGELDQAARGRMRAGAKAIIAGDDKASWRDPLDADKEVPWSMRPAIFRTALAECFSEGMHTSHALASKIRYQVKRTLAPLPPRVAPDSDAGVIALRPRNRDGSERYTQTGGNRGDMGKPVVTIGAGGKVNADTTAFEQGTADTRAIQEWMEAHPTETVAFKERVQRQMDSSGDHAGPAAGLTAAMRLRQMVRAAIAMEGAA